MGSIGIPGGLEAGQPYLGSWLLVFLCIPMDSIGIPGNFEAGETYLGSLYIPMYSDGIYRNTW